MKSPTRQRLPRPLSSRLELRRASCEADLQAVLECHVAAFGEEDEASLRSNLLARPGARPEDTLFVVDTSTAKVVSSVGLVPQTWTYEGIPFPVGQASVVSTRVGYRGRGLVREQFSEYHRIALRAGCVMSVIEGIPYFYRQFGYEYSIPMGGGVDLSPELVPDEAAENPLRNAPLSRSGSESRVLRTCPSFSASTPRRSVGSTLPPSCLMRYGSIRTRCQKLVATARPPT
jgi:predicted N-acetyltransferase YhbS